MSKASICVLAAAGLFCLGMAVGSISKNAFYVVDADENSRAYFGISPNQKQTPQLALRDVSGNDRLWIGMNDDDEPVIYFYDEARTAVLYIDSTGVHTYGEAGPDSGAAGAAGKKSPPPDEKNWSWPRNGSDVWGMTIWFGRPGKGEVSKFHTAKCATWAAQKRAGAVKKGDITHRTVRAAHKFFKDRLEPCHCCSHLFPKR